MRLVALLRSARFALLVIAFVGAYSALGAWVPWALPEGGPAPTWARAMGLDHPFSAPAFLVGIALLFASTLACTWGKRGRLRRLEGGELPASAIRLEPRAGASPEAFLRTQGFRLRGAAWIRGRAGLWGGWVMHLGLLVLMLGVLLQQSLADTGLFELAEGETTRLAGAGTLLSRERGILARASPPDLGVRLQWFDAYARRDGFAPDRRSQLVVDGPGREPAVFFLDRAAGVRAGGVKFFQAIPTGLALDVEIAGLGRRAIHLRSARGGHVAVASVAPPGGGELTFTVTSERAMDDPEGTGALLTEVRVGGTARRIEPGVPFPFGDRTATLKRFTRWGEFTYARTPGMAGVFAGFALVLAGCALLLVPAGVARVEAEGGARVWAGRGAAVLAEDWRREAEVHASAEAERTGRS